MNTPDLSSADDRVHIRRMEMAQIIGIMSATPAKQVREQGDSLVSEPLDMSQILSEL
ncbi:hypothetical protein [Thalassospira profundimaris]|uniref:hypothetical protein n=1 Tax=Thalassospira profundimaris TaxID=502049 RepID=UPI001C690254|nr:hypothetical protein [Thalassospira profundimaris]